MANDLSERMRTITTMHEVLCRTKGRLQPIAAHFRIDNIGKVKTQSPTFRETIDGTENNYTLIRAFLAASVIYYHSFWLTKATGHLDHASEMLLPTASVGGLAVQAFFFLSGLFVAQSYFRDRNVLRFAIKRSLRIWPGLFFCLVVSGLLAGFISRPRDLFNFLLFSDFYDYILRNSIFQLTWDIRGVFDGNQYASINGSIHTLPLEAKMYVVLAFAGLLGLLSTLRRSAACGVLLLTLTLLPPSLVSAPFNLFDADYSRGAAAMFFGGVVVFGLSGNIRLRAWHGLILIVPLLFITGPLHVALFYLVMMWALIVLGQSAWLRGVWQPRYDLSYGIYLYGWPCQQYIVHLYPHINPYLLSALAIPLAGVFALLSWVLIEKPAISFGHYLAAKRRRQSAVVGNGAPSVTSRRSPLKDIALVVGMLAVCMAMNRLVRSRDFVPVVPLNAQIVDYGPRHALAGGGINVQANGESAIWIKLDATPPAGTRVVFAGSALETQIGEKMVTAKVGANLISKQGERSICLELRKWDFIERSNCVALMLT